MDRTHETDDAEADAVQQKAVKCLTGVVVLAG